MKYIILHRDEGSGDWRQFDKNIYDSFYDALAVSEKDDRIVLYREPGLA